MIDEYRLVIHPVGLGAGEWLFTAPLAIEAISTAAFSGRAAHGTVSRRAHVMVSSADRSVCVGVSSPNKIIASMRASS